MRNVDDLRAVDHARIEVLDLRLVVIVRQRRSGAAVEQAAAPRADDVDTLGRRVIAVREVIDRTAKTDGRKRRLVD